MNCTTAPAEPADLARRQFVSNRVLVILVSAAALGLPFLYAPHVAHGFILCPLHGLIGLPCPACGLTRAFCALTRLDLLQALQLNALSLPLVVLFSVAPVVALLELRRGRRCAFYGFLYSTRVATRFGATLVIYHLARVSYWIYDGTLVTQYVHTSWTYTLLKAWFCAV